MKDLPPVKDENFHPLYPYKVQKAFVMNLSSDDGRDHLTTKKIKRFWNIRTYGDTEDKMVKPHVA